MNPAQHAASRMTRFERTEIRTMTEADIAYALRLSTIAGWNQSEQDWRRFLELQQGGCFVAVRDGVVVGTVTTLPYDKRLGWIGMLLVDPKARKYGIGTRLFEMGMEFLRSVNTETQKLDATPMGQVMYGRLGFQAEYQVERWEAASASSDDASELSMMEESDLARICERDREVFGADRSALLKRLWKENPRCTAVVYHGGVVCGYMLGRYGRRAHHLGPWIADDTATAWLLLMEFTARFRGAPVYVDICLENPAAREMVVRAGFCCQRSLTRMYHGPNRYPGQLAKVYGIAGPELG